MFWLSDEAWDRIDPHLPHGRPGKPGVDDRRVLSGILHVLKTTGCRWRDVPVEYGPATTVYNRYNRWSQRHLAAPVREAGGVRRDAGRVDARQHSREGAPLGGGRKRGEWAQAVGVSRGGRTSKVHCLADTYGRPVAFSLTPGNIADISMAVPLLETMAPPRRVIADKAYDADRLRRWLEERRITAVIPSTARRHTPYPLNRRAYHRRNQIERLFCKLKNWRRIATRYDRLARNYLAASPSPPSLPHGPYESPT